MFDLPAVQAVNRSGELSRFTFKPLLNYNERAVNRKAKHLGIHYKGRFWECRGWSFRLEEVAGLFSLRLF